jgi:hypothetical protein
MYVSSTGGEAVARGGFSRLPSGHVVVTLTLSPPEGGDQGIVRVVVFAVSRQRALTRLRNLGFRAPRLSGNAEPPTPDEISAVLHHPEGLVWRPYDAPDTEPWHPVSVLRRLGANG